MIKEVEATFGPICDGAHKAWKTAVAKRDGFLNPLKDAQKSVKGLMSAYDAEQDRLRRDEQARLEAIQRAEEEKKRQEELARIAAEKKAEEDRLLQAATEAEASGDKETADQLAAAAVQVETEKKEEMAAVQTEPIHTAPVVLAKTTPKLQGGPVYRTIWKARIVNEAIIPRTYLVPDMVKINGVARSLKGQTNIPGVTAYEERC
jgi:multidrug efflux pump subunit AcrA (membrane-fusion protein)